MAAPPPLELELTCALWPEPLLFRSDRTVLLGREAELDVVLDASGVSKRHCEISCRATGVIVRDLGSTNGTFLNGRWISESALHDGDVLGVGPRTQVKVRLRRAVAGDACGACGEKLSEAEQAGGGRYRDPAAAYCLRCVLAGAGQFEAFGPYRVLRRLGEGLTGQVFEAADPANRRRVALKVLRSAPDPDQPAARREARFRREIEVLKRLDHPAIVRCLDSGFASHQAYLAMEFVDGHDLAQELEGRGRPFDPPELTSLVLTVTDALDHAHSRGVVHRDIKPGNLLRDEAGQVKITDFGLALTHEGSTVLTSSGGILGTLEFTAPEQARDAHASDGRADVYSLAATLFYLVTGQWPFQARTDYQLLMLVLSAPPPKLSSARSGLPKDLERLLERSLAKDPAERPQTPMEFGRLWASAAGPTGR